MLTKPCIARRTALVAIVTLALGACQDSSVPTAPLPLHPRLTQVAATPVVNSLSDPGDGTCDDTECTLREAIAFASSGATITFSVTGTITLTSRLTLNNPVTISGPGPDQLSISGGGVDRIFTNYANGAIISGITITGGYVSVGGGAGIWNNSTLTIIDCAITGNTGFYTQGGGIRNTGTLTIKSSTISNNTGHPSAAGLSSDGTTLLLNSTVSGNVANGGGSGVAVFVAGTLRAISSTIAGNTGDGIMTYSTGTTVLKNSIVWGNSGGDIDEYTAGGTTSLGYNLIGVTGSAALTAEFTNTGDQTGVANAHLGTLAVNSPGHTATYALLTGSTAIDAGSCTDHLDAAIATDQRGVARPQGSACDIGAYELVVSGTTTPTFEFNLATLPAHSFGDTPFSVAGYVTRNSTGAVTFATGASSVGCTVSSAGLVTITGAAIDDAQACFIEATLAPDATYAGAGPISQSFQIARAAGSVSISNIPSSASVGGSFTPTYTKAGDGTASTQSNSTGVCTVTSGVVNYIAEGTCLLQASVTQGTNHLAATGTEQSFSISMAAPTFAFDLSSLPAKTYGDETFSVATYATTNSSGAVTFDTGAGSVGCSVTSTGTVTITGAAVDPNSCILEASVAADGTYSGAGPLSQSFHIAKATGSVSISNLPASGSIGGSFTPEYLQVGDGTPSTGSNSPSVCTVTSGVVSYLSAGTCRLQASITAGTDYLAATGTEQTFTVSLATPDFNFDLSELPAKTFGSGTFSVASYALSNSNGAITFALGTGSVGCSVTSAGMVTLEGAAVDPSHCIIEATLAADGGYSGAGPINQSINIAKAVGSVSISNMPPSAIIGGNFTPAYTKAGDGTASTTSQTPSICSVAGGVVSFNAAGECILTASVTEGTNHLAATGNQQTVNVVSGVGLFSSACTYTVNAKNGQRQVTVSWENANPGVTKIEVSDGRVLNKALAPTTAGSWTTSVKTGVPTYGLWGGTSRKDSGTQLQATTACTQN